MPRQTKEEVAAAKLTEVANDLFVFVDFDKDGKVLGCRLAHRDLQRVAVSCGWLPVLQEQPRKTHPMKGE